MSFSYFLLSIFPKHYSVFFLLPLNLCCKQQAFSWQHGRKHFFFFLGHLYPVGTIFVYFLHLASVRRKPGISNPFTLQIFLFCDNIETFQRNGLEGTRPTPPCNLSSDMFEQYEIYNYKSLSNGLVPDQRLRINLHLLWVLFPEILVS